VYGGNNPRECEEVGNPSEWNANDTQEHICRVAYVPESAWSVATNPRMPWFIGCFARRRRTR